MQRRGTPFVLEVRPKIPARLNRLEELAGNLAYSWDRGTREVFARLNPPLWEALGHSPKALLRRIDERRLREAAEDPVFLNSYERALSTLDAYLADRRRRNGAETLKEDDLVAYFCAEFGFHESLPIYSGGLGILAGDHCKAASDARLPFVGVGLLYRQGYFHQEVDGAGNQHAEYHDSDFAELPIEPARKSDGGEAHVQVELPGCVAEVKVWQVRIGHVTLYLLDTDLECNRERERDIAHRLYGGDRNTRIEQEMVLGIGGVRALEALGIRPTIWHINEGHPAFLVLERARELVRQGADFETALEAVAANTVFTTHTAVAAGHDHFSEELLRGYFEGYCRELKLEPAKLVALGRTASSPDFNMTALAVRGARHYNGVSRIHGGVTSEILKDLWPQVPAEENPIAYVTNGVHVPTFVAPEWIGVFERFVGYDWAQRLDEAEFWKAIESVPDHVFWSARQQLKAKMLHLVRYRVRQQHLRNQGSESHLERLLRFADPENPNVLTIGFGRRFATYKRALLLLRDLDILRQIAGDRERPVVFLYAGKAHPADVPGQDLIRQLARVARMPEFEGRILFVEGYDLRLARRLVSGVDVWLNTPQYPLEASGTSGMKAAFNGAINFSVLDGWWGEGYQGDNGWAIKPASLALPQEERDREESQTLYEILQDRVIPLYYSRGSAGYPPEWIRIAKRSMASLLPRFNSVRMLREYVTAAYAPAAEIGRRYRTEGLGRAREIAAWKARVRASWERLRIRALQLPPRRLEFGETAKLAVSVTIDGLAPSDVTVELLLWDATVARDGRPARFRFEPAGAAGEGGEQRYELELEPEFCGKLDYRIRMYPCHELLTHPFELGLMQWL
jgi:starch phosphorylase